MATIVIKSYERLGNNGEPIDEEVGKIKKISVQNWILDQRIIK